MKKLGKIKNLLSREEMKQIQGGSGFGFGCVGLGSLCVVNSSGQHTSCCNNKTCKSSSGYGHWGLCV